MSSTLTGKFIANTFQRLFQRSGNANANGYESVDFINGGLQDDSLTLLNGLGQKIKGFIFDRGDPVDDGGDGGIYIQTPAMKNNKDFGLRLDVNNERANITSKNKDILISTDNSTPSDILVNRRRLILKGGVPGSMSSTYLASELNGGVYGNLEQLTLQLQGRLSVEHTSQISLNVSSDGIEELALVSGIYTKTAGAEYQMWQKVGNIVTVSGVWETDGAGEIPVPIKTTGATQPNIIRAYGVGDYPTGSCFISPISGGSTTNVVVKESGLLSTVNSQYVSISYSYVLEF